jgi:type IV secretory pathway VirD2 relaxase
MPNRADPRSAFRLRGHPNNQPDDGGFPLTGIHGVARGKHLKHRGAVGPFIPASPSNSRQVVVLSKVHPSGAGTSHHLAYLGREQAGRDGQQAQLFSREGERVDPEHFAKLAALDQHQFRLVISPQDSHRLDLVAYTRSLMDQVDRDFGRRTVWIGAAHFNTDHHHVHLTIRGADQTGESLYIKKDYLQKGLRYQAQTLATQLLGPRQTPESPERQSQFREQIRWTYSHLEEDITRERLWQGLNRGMDGRSEHERIPVGDDDPWAARQFKEATRRRTADRAWDQGLDR